MKKLIVSIDRLIDSEFPGWVQCSLVDAYGKKHLFNEKIPVVLSSGELTESELPKEGSIRCKAVGISPGGRGAMMLVNTFDIDRVESTEGITEFAVSYDKVISAD